MPLSDLRVYLSGSMRSRSRWGVEAFEAAAVKLRGLGALVHVPTEEGLRRGFHPDEEYRDREDVPEVVEANVSQIFESDLVVLLPGWRESGESEAERTIAAVAGVPVVELRDLLTASSLGPRKTFLLVS